MKVHGQVGEFGDPVQQVVVRDLRPALVSIVVGYHALEVGELIQEAAKVNFNSLLHNEYKTRKMFLVEGSWSTWDAWGTCSTSCGQGIKSRSRGHSDGTPCSGSSTQTGFCQG